MGLLRETAREDGADVLVVAHDSRLVPFADNWYRLEDGRFAGADEPARDPDVKAPGDGTVLRVLVLPGDVLGPQSRRPAVLFCPAGERIVRAEVEQEFASRVAEGQAAVIQDDARKGRVRHGKVRHVSDWFTRRRSVIQEPTQFNDVRTLECIISLAPKQPPLRIGQRLGVRIGGPATGMQDGRQECLPHGARASFPQPVLTPRLDPV